MPEIDRSSWNLRSYSRNPRGYYAPLLFGVQSFGADARRSAGGGWMRSNAGFTIIALAFTASISIAAEGPPFSAYGTPPAPPANPGVNAAGGGGRAAEGG